MHPRKKKHVYSKSENTVLSPCQSHEIQQSQAQGSAPGPQQSQAQLQVGQRMA